MKLSLVIDGNFLLYKDVFILYEEKTLYSELLQLLRNDFNNLLKMYAFDSIYFISDSKLRWRQQYYKEYKQNRTPDDKIEWEYVFDTFDSFKDELKNKNNISFYEIDWLEGDDLISYIVNKNNEKSISNFIVSADSDLHQLLDFDINLKYINMMYNFKLSDERLYLPLNYNIFLSEVNIKNNNIFDMNDDEDMFEFLYKLINKTKVKEVSSKEFLFCKLISGDRKDNVPSAYIKNNRGIGSTGSLNIYNLYNEIHLNEIDFDSDEFINKLTETISLNKNIIDQNIKDEIKNNLIRNRKLLRLNENYLPINLKNEINNRIKIY